MPNERVTISLPPEVVRDIDLRERNRSKFILQAVRRELERRRREALRRSLENPHPESLEMAELGFADWVGRLAEGDEDLLDPAGGTAVRWIPGEGWREIEE